MTTDIERLRLIATGLSDLLLGNAESVVVGNDTYLAGGTYLGEVVPKERPRKGAAGNMYTPTKTRQFETSVAKWGKLIFAAPYSGPVRVDLTIFDKTADQFLLKASAARLAHDDHGDLDNYEKAIFDGLNKVAWTDDKKIVYKSTTRRYAAEAGFSIDVARYGLAKHDLETLRRLMGAK